MSVHLHNSAALSALKEPAGNIEYRAGWSDEPGWTLRRRENHLWLPGFEPRSLDSPFRSLVVTPTALYLPQCESRSQQNRLGFGVDWTTISGYRPDRGYVRTVSKCVEFLDWPNNC